MSYIKKEWKFGIRHSHLRSGHRQNRRGGQLFANILTHISIGQMVLKGWANETQKDEYLPKTCDGRSIMAFVLTEPLAGSGPSSMVTKFEDRGTHFLLNGKNTGLTMVHSRKS